jgi:hypothetical protein
LFQHWVVKVERDGEEVFAGVALGKIGAGAD